jgi:hypothetical protein
MSRNQRCGSTYPLEGDVRRAGEVSNLEAAGDTRIEGQLNLLIREAKR